MPRQRNGRTEILQRSEANRQIVAQMIIGISTLPEGTVLTYDQLMTMAGLPFETEEDIATTEDQLRQSTARRIRNASLKRMRSLLNAKVKDALIVRYGIHLKNVRLVGYAIEHQGDAIKIYEKEFAQGIKKTGRARTRADHIRVDRIDDERARVHTVESQARMNTLTLAMQNAGVPLPE